MTAQTEVFNSVLALCRAWFEQRDVQGALTYMAQDVCFAGGGEQERVRGIEQMAAYLSAEIHRMAEPYQMETALLDAQPILDQAYGVDLELSLRNAREAYRLRAFFVLVQQKGAWRVKRLQWTRLDAGRQESGAQPQRLTDATRQRLLDGSLSGGMMGGYIEPGFPFYFINRRMLDYLGYASEADFIQDTGGLIAHCIHPDDRKRVEGAVKAQLAEKNEYAVDYRMKKQDGSYIWVHDLGCKVTAEDGRAAIASVCMDVTAQKRAQDEVLRLYNNIPGAVFCCLLDGQLSIVYANDGLFECVGYTRQELEALGNRFSALLHPDDWQRWMERINAHPLCQQTIEGETRLLCKGGAVKWVLLRAQLFEEDGRRALHCVFVDITDEKRLRQRIKELYEKEMAYFAQLSGVQGGVQCTLNVRRDRMVSWQSSQDAHAQQSEDSYTDAMERLADSAVDTAYGEKLRRTLSREKVLADYAAGKVDYHFRFLRRRKGGGLFWGSTSVHTCQNPESGDVICFLYTKDVTHEKLQELLLHRIAALEYERITEVDLNRDSYRVISFGGGVEMPLQGQFQRELHAVASRYLEGAAKDEYLEKLGICQIAQRLAQQDAYSFVVEMKDEQGENRVKRYQVFYTCKALGRVCVARADVTDIVRKEQRQKQELASALVAAEQANAAKSDFLSRMSHEIRTPMNAIIGMSAIAAQSLGDEEQVADCIAKIGISSRFLLSLINDILDMSRIESGKMLLKNEKIPMEEFLGGINSICYAQAESKGVEYECIVDPVLDDYYIGDAMKLQQVLINILSNAIKFTGEGGKVTFSAEQRRRAKDDAMLRFIVNDTGVGMSEEFLPHLFEPFSQEATDTTALYGGTGLGLAISKSIVDMMDGKITIRSIKGIGTEFTVDVRLGITEEEKLRHNQKKQQMQFSHLKTLVVDDDVAVCESAVLTLREMGVVAEWMDSGRKAIERVRTLWGQGKFYDMILIDWKMPEMDGIETARRIRAIVGPEVTIIIMTAYDWISIEHEAKLAGVNLLMSKPMFKSSLISAFSKALGEKEDKAVQNEAAEYAFAGKRVLLVEDNQINTEVAAVLLRSKGFAVETAENGLRAIELFSKSPNGYYDAILMDIRMPIMDGLSAAANIRHLTNADARTVPIIAMTANAFDDDIEKSKAAGMNAHLAKPIEPDRLYQTLYDFICAREG